MTSKDRTNVATRGVLTRLESRKSFFLPGLHPDPAVELTTLPHAP